MPKTIQAPSLAQHDSQYGPVSDIWDSSGGPRWRLAADDFKTTGADSVSAVTWWGFYENADTDCFDDYNTSGSEAEDLFTITYYESVIHSQTGERVPGSVIASFDSNDLDISRSEYFDQFVSGDIQVYMYTATNDAVSFESGGCYFIEIKNSGGDTDGASGCHWRWNWSSDGDIQYAVKKAESESSYANAS